MATMAGGNVSATLKEALVETLTAILSPTQEVRTAGEEHLKVLEVTEEFGVHLAELTVDIQGPLAIRQLASVLLKQYVEVHWSSNAEKYRPPETAEMAKAAIRTILPNGLLEPVSKVRSSVAYAISAIARWDWPEAWPELFDLMMRLLTSGEENATHGAMRVLTEFTREVTDTQMPQVAPVILPELYKIFVSYEKYGVRTRGRAVEIFCTCAGMISDMSEYDKDMPRTLLFPFLPSFAEALVQTLQQEESPHYDSGLKMEVLKALGLLVLHFPKQIVQWMPHILTPVWNTLTQSAIVYVKTVVNDNDAAYEAVDSDGEVLGFENLVFNIFDFVHALVESAKFRKTVKKGLPDLIYYIIQYMQITEDQVNTWLNDPDRFVEDEDEDTFSYSVRISSQDLLLSISTEFEQDCGPGLASAVTRLLQEAEQAKGSGNPHWWKIHEACMLALGTLKDLLGQLDPSPFDMSGFLQTVVVTDINNPCSPFLLGRCLWIASKFPTFATEDLLQRLLQATVNALQDTNPPTVRVSAVRAVWGFCEHLKSSKKTQHLMPFLGPSLEGLVQLATQYSSDVLSLVLDTLTVLLSVDAEFTASVESKVCPLTIAVFLKYNSDPLITSLAQDIFKELCKNPRCQPAVEHRLVPTLVSILNAQADKIANGLQAVTLDILQTVVRSSPTPLSAALMNQAFPAAAQCTLRTDDNSTLQNGGECIRAYLVVAIDQVCCYTDPEGNNGLWYVVQIATQLLNPRSSEFSAAFVGRLITTLIRQAGNQLGDSLDLLLKAVLSKMQQAETLSVMQNLVMVFANLLHTQLEAVLSFLSSVPSPTGKAALEFVLEEWCAKHHLFFGAYESKVSTVALCRLLEHGVTTNDSRIVGIQVKGDQIHSMDSGIKTRSKAQQDPDQWTVIPLVVKIFKLIINELANAFEDALSKGKDGDESDPYEEDDSEQDDDSEGSSVTDQQKLQNLISQIDSNAHMIEMEGGYDDDNDADDPDASKDPIFHTDMKVYLKNFLTSFSQQPCFGMFTPHLTPQERQVLQTIGIPF